MRTFPGCKLAASACLVVFAPLVAAGDDSRLEDIRAALDAYDSSIVTARGAFTIATLRSPSKPVPKNALRIERKVFQWVEDRPTGAVLLDQTNYLQNGSVNREWVANAPNEKQTDFLFYVDQSTPLRLARRSGKNPRVFSTETPFWFVGLSTSGTGESLSKLLRRGRAAHSGMATFDGRTCERVSVEYAVGGTPATMALLLDPSCSLLPRRLELSLRGKPFLTLTTTEYRKVREELSGQEVWFPFSGTIGRHLSAEEISFQLESVSLNGSVEAREFAVDVEKLPDGVVIEGPRSDRFTGKRRDIYEANRMRLEASFGRGPESQTLVPQTAAPIIAEQPRRSSSVLLLGLAISAGLLAAAIWLRRRYQS